MIQNLLKSEYIQLCGEKETTTDIQILCNNGRKT